MSRKGLLDDSTQGHLCHRLDRIFVNNMAGGAVVVVVGGVSNHWFGGCALVAYVIVSLPWLLAVFSEMELPARSSAFLTRLQSHVIISALALSYIFTLLLGGVFAALILMGIGAVKW